MCNLFNFNFFLSSLLLLFVGLDYISIIFVSIYVGALSILFLFVIMMLNIKDFYSSSNFLFYFILFFFIFFYFFFEYFRFKYNLILEFNILDFSFFDIIIKKNIIYIIGFYLYTTYWLYFILCGFVLFIAILGSVVLVLEPYKITKNQNIYQQISRMYNNSYLKIK